MTTKSQSLEKKTRQLAAHPQCDNVQYCQMWGWVFTCCLRRFIYSTVEPAPYLNWCRSLPKWAGHLRNMLNYVSRDSYKPENFARFSFIHLSAMRIHSFKLASPRLRSSRQWTCVIYRFHWLLTVPTMTEIACRAAQPNIAYCILKTMKVVTVF